MKLYIGSDLSGFTLKESVRAYLEEAGYDFEDLGTQSEDNAYPFFTVAEKVAKAVQQDEGSQGILICGTGAGMAIVANKFKGIRATVVESTYTARMCRAINDSNIMTMGGWIIGNIVGVEIVKTYLGTDFLQGLEDWRQVKLKQARQDVLDIEASQLK